MPDRIEPLQLLDLGFGDLPFLDLRAQLSVGLRQFARPVFNLALKPFFNMFAIGDFQSDAEKRNRQVVLEIGLPTRPDPAFHAVRFSDYPVFDFVDSIAPWIGAPLDRSLNAREIV